MLCMFRLKSPVKNDNSGHKTIEEDKGGGGGGGGGGGRGGHAIDGGRSGKTVGGVCECSAGFISWKWECHPAAGLGDLCVTDKQCKQKVKCVTIEWEE